MRTKFDSVCFKCKKPVPAGEGYFQAVQGMNKEQRKKYAGKRWLVRCPRCVGAGN